MDDLIGLLKQAEFDAEDKLARARSARRILEGKDKPGRKPVSAATTPSAPPADPAASKPPKKRRGRRRSTRADQALALVETNPGITANKIAEEMKIKANYVYRVMAELEKGKKVKKAGRTYTAA
jgi:DNA invertase Pin-like site-specific DNA recombinase